MKAKVAGKSEKIYINEIIRINFKCNWKCKFCNVFETNNYGDTDVSSKKVVHQILSLTKKYTAEERKNIILSLSGWETTINPQLTRYIRLAKSLWIGTVEIQTNGTMLFIKKPLIEELIEAGLDEIFLAQHSHLKEVNDELGAFYKVQDFLDWVEYVKERWLDKKVSIYLNIVVGKINLPYLTDFLKFLKNCGFTDFITATRWVMDDGTEKNLRKISFWLTQPNGYAELNADQVLLKFDEKEMKDLTEAIDYCAEAGFSPDFHFTSPPLCVLPYPAFNLEYNRLKKLEQHEETKDVMAGNLESYKFLWKEKMKFDGCEKCTYNKYCLGFYKNWVNFFWEEYAEQKVTDFLKTQ